MKRFLFLATAVVFTAMLVSPSFAVEASFDGGYSIRAIALDNNQDFNDDRDEDMDSFIDQEFRLGITMKDGPVKGYVQFNMGDYSSSSYDDRHLWGSGQANGNDFNIYVRQAYLDFPIGPVQLKIGRSYESHGFLAGGMFENIADRYILTYNVTPELATSFVHSKRREGSVTSTTNNAINGTTANSLASPNSNDNDWNIYNLGFRYKPESAPFDLGARVYYVRDGKYAISQAGAFGSGTTSLGDWDAWWLTADTNLNFNPINIYLSGAYVVGKSRLEGAANGLLSDQEYDIEGWAVHGDLNATFGPIKVGLVGGIGSGDDNTGDNKLNTFFAPASASYLQTHIFFQSGENNYCPSVLNTSNLNLQNGSNETLSNVTWYGVYGDYKATSDLTLGAKAAYLEQTERILQQDEKIGIEYNLTLNYKLHKGLSLLAFAAWLDPDDALTGRRGDITYTTANPAPKDDIVSVYYANLVWEF